MNSIIIFIVCFLLSDAFGGLSEEERRLFLDEHNRLRSELARATPVANMKKLKYDMNLENEAQGRADQCLYEHNIRQFMEKGTNDNLYYTTYKISRTEAIREAVNGWWEENKDYTYSEPYQSSRGFPVTTHYTQAAWANTSRIGCGMRSDCSDGDGNPIKIIIICDYHYRGNWVGDSFYKVGEICSQCERGATCDRQMHLCVEGGEDEAQPSDKNGRGRENQRGEDEKNMIPYDNGGRRQNPKEYGRQDNRNVMNNRQDNRVNNRPFDRNQNANNRPLDRYQNENNRPYDRNRDINNRGKNSNNRMENPNRQTEELLRQTKAQIADMNQQLKKVHSQQLQAHNYAQQMRKELQQKQAPLERAQQQLQTKQHLLHIKQRDLAETQQELKYLRQMRV